MANGLIIGRAVGRSTLVRKIKALLDMRINAKTACEMFFAGRNRLLRLSSPHTLVVSPTGGGKGVSGIIPFLLTNRESAVVIDWKDGENAKITRKARKKMGHRDVLLDPWRLVTAKPDRLNALDTISKDSPRAVDDCNRLGNAMVVRTGQEKEPHWNDKTEAWIGAMAAATVFYGQKDKGTRSLLKVADMLSNPAEMKAGIELMQQSPEVWGGALARMGGQLAHSVGEELASTLSTIGRHIKFLNTPVVAESVRDSTFDPAELRKGRMTVYLIMPAMYMHSHAALMRMWLVTLMGSVMKGGLQ